ncbi:nitroreductase family deazaflavin-dependent oxidoreductase [Lacisediminihabitans sp.]|uniref:nitroreductase family deazaflavin-dependent oxidoreductase n=1 Tax=Lacisediminihabitans sp. TaxID=2787631 RepID=UPI00374DEECA
MNDWNDSIMAEFRANDGRLGGRWSGVHLLLLHTTGRTTGQERVSPMMYFRRGDVVYVIASKAGAPTHPAWYLNLVADPHVSVELATTDGVETWRGVAEPVSGPERERLFAEFTAVAPGFGAYQEGTDRVIPIVAVRRA